jgi:hypothetical protein
MLVAAAADAAWFSASTLVMPLLVAVPTFNVAFALVGLVTHLSALYSRFASASLKINEKMKELSLFSCVIFTDSKHFFFGKVH